jgi:hypothetical protein
VASGVVDNIVVARAAVEGAVDQVGVDRVVAITAVEVAVVGVDRVAASAAVEAAGVDVVDRVAASAAVEAAGVVFDRVGALAADEDVTPFEVLHYVIATTEAAEHFSRRIPPIGTGEGVAIRGAYDEGVAFEGRAG